MAHIPWPLSQSNPWNCIIQVVYNLIRKPGWSTGVVNGKRQNPNGNFHTGFAVPFTVAGFCRVKGTIGTHNFRSEIPFGNFGLPFKKSCFPRKFSIWEDQISLSIYIPTEISGFFFVNGKQPQ